MPIINATKKTTLAATFEECTTYWQQTKGMMFRKRTEALLFPFPKEQTIRLHSYFCPDAIDLIFLDSSWEVVEIKSEWEKRSTYANTRPAQFLLEMPPGTIAQSRTDVGDVVHILKK